MEKAREFQEKIYFCLTDYAKAFVWITTNCGKFLRDGISDHITCLLRNLCVGQEATVRDLHRPTGSKLGKEYDKAYVITMII